MEKNESAVDFELFDVQWGTWHKEELKRIQKKEEIEEIKNKIEKWNPQCPD